jgi:hypothetical protein
MVIEAHKPKALQARIYGEKIGDYQTVSSWWEARHGVPLMETLLPPLGIIVEDEKGPCAALWCYECFGVGVCFLEFAISRPGQSVRRTKVAMAMAVEACVRVAKTHGDFSYFKCFTTTMLANHIESLGFTPLGEPLKPLATRRD